MHAHCLIVCCLLPSTKVPLALICKSINTLRTCINGTPPLTEGHHLLSQTPNEPDFIEISVASACMAVVPASTTQHDSPGAPELPLARFGSESFPDQLSRVDSHTAQSQVDISGAIPLA